MRLLETCGRKLMTAMDFNLFDLENDAGDKEFFVKS